MKKIKCGFVNIQQKEIGCSRCEKKASTGHFTAVAGIVRFYCSIICLMNLPKKIGLYDK